MRTDALDYDLPTELIATRPAEPRDAARLLVVRRGNEAFSEHATVADLPRYLDPGDTLVLNRTAVVPARIVGHRDPSGGRVEGLYLSEPAPGRWVAMLQCNGRLRTGDRIELVDAEGAAAGVRLELVEPAAEGWALRVDPPAPAAELLARVGRTPLPPYIRRARGGDGVVGAGTGGEADAVDRVWYETVFADPAERRSVAAPTAGLHFTPALLAALEARGVRRGEIVLDVGPGTFKPVTTETLERHVMHAERYAVPAETIAMLEGPGRTIAVGTTVVRALESLADPPVPGPATTDLLIAPPYGFRRVDGMLTNFHLPRSTLLALVAAMLGLERTLAVYREAVARRYRFYSYGDAMLILPAVP